MYKQQLPETLSSRSTYILLSRNQTYGAPEWGPKCSMSILINGNVACLCILFSSMGHSVSNHPIFGRLPALRLRFSLDAHHLCQNMSR